MDTVDVVLVLRWRCDAVGRLYTYLLSNKTAVNAAEYL